MIIQVVSEYDVDVVELTEEFPELWEEFKQANVEDEYEFVQHLIDEFGVGVVIERSNVDFQDYHVL